MKTYQPKAKDLKRNWHLVDAQDKILGRLASDTVKFLMGKHKVTYAYQADVGDYVVVTNSDKIKVSGKKELQKIYYRHSGYPGGLKAIEYSRLKKENPQKILELAVKRMLPVNRLRDIRMKRLKIFIGEKHPYGDKFADLQ